MLNKGRGQNAIFNPIQMKDLREKAASLVRHCEVRWLLTALQISAAVWL